jgi:hypothetical protein
LLSLVALVVVAIWRVAVVLAVICVALLAKIQAV